MLNELYELYESLRHTMAGIWSSVTASHRSGVCMHKLINKSFRMWRVPLLRRLVICKDSILTRNRCLILSETWWQKHIAELHAELDRGGHVRTVGMWNRDKKKYTLQWNALTPFPRICILSKMIRILRLLPSENRRNWHMKRLFEMRTVVRKCFNFDSVMNVQIFSTHAVAFSSSEIWFML